ncbi:MAG: GspE/PulE family protein [Gammaproteobacteria bacterium]|nr:GspE/PulE family protein [Gammaproteobacteria bacterium]MBU1731849.1 GspE/PulE family protein [Gammaproteobacteria bacterium]MBU1892460.1 GspE/PulE family protein [Gammaproteobacteria bacterium]
MQDTQSIETRRHPVVLNASELDGMLDGRQQFRHASLGSLLVQEKIITQTQLDDALDYQSRHPDKKLGVILAEKGAATVPQICLAVARSLGSPIVCLSGFDFDHKALAMVTPDLVRDHYLIPLMFHGERLVIAMEDLLDTDAIHAISFITQRAIEPVFAPRDEIRNAINKYYDLQEQERELDRLELSDFYYEDDQEVWREAERLANETPVVKLVDNLILAAIHQRASDIHIRPGSKKVDLLYRIDGTLVHKREIQKGLLPAIVSRIKIICRLNIAEHRLPQDGSSRMQDGKNIVDMRISTIPCQFGESVVIRLLNKGEGLRSVKDIGFSERDETLFTHLINKSFGILLVTGPTGSGKTTTLYAAMREVARHSLNIVTVEDPVEYEFEGMRQIHILPQIHFGFPQALRHILRHDPDVIMIGEIRDEETAKIAVESALTGHLVLSTLHTNDAPGAITRLIEMGVEPYLLKSAVIGVIAQRLIRRNCPHCVAEEEVDPFVRASLGVSESEVFYRGQGCERCNRTGYLGRLAAYELLVVNENIRSQIMPGIAGNELRKLAVQEGMVTLTANAIERARSRETSLAEVYRVCLEVL